MLPIVDKPVIQYVVEELVDAGIKDIIIVTGYHKRTIEDHFDAPSFDLVENLKLGGAKKAPLLKELEKISELANFVYVRQKGPYGNGTPLLNVKHLIGNEPFIYAWSDDFIVAKPSRFKQLLQVYEKYQCTCLGSMRVNKDEDYNRYGFAGGREIEPGILDADKIIEKPGKAQAPSDLANVSGFVFTPDIFEFLLKAQEQLTPGQELWYNDAIKLMLESKKRVLAVEIKGGKFYDTGNKLDYLKTVVEFALKREDLGPQFKAYLHGLKLTD